MRTLTFLRDHPVLIAAVVGLVIATLVLGLIALMMFRAGLSLRPIAFMAVFLGIIAGPQLVYHVLRAFDRIPDVNGPRTAAVASGVVENEAALEVRDRRFVSGDLVFGSGFDPSLRTDVRRLFPNTDVQTAEMAIFRTADTAIVARFNSADSALSAMRVFVASAVGDTRGLNGPGPHTLQRAQDWLRVFVAGRTLFIWSSAQRDQLAKRQTASSACWSERAGSTAANNADARKLRTTRQVFALVAVALVALAIVWFFKGSSWAASVSPRQNLAQPAMADDLMATLLRIDGLGQPVTVQRGEKDNVVEVTWRIDAAWLAQTGAHGMRRVHKLRLELDPESRVVRVREFTARLNGSAGPNGLRLDWQAAAGIVFFEYAKEVNAGFFIDPNTGEFRVRPDFRYTFNLQELKAPLISAVTTAGWTWKPVQWTGPSWLRWLTE
jgi:hypothetical protein